MSCLRTEPGTSEAPVDYHDLHMGEIIKYILSHRFHLDEQTFRHKGISIQNHIVTIRDWNDLPDFFFYC